MVWYDQATYGNHIAEVYDDIYAEVDPACIDLLAELAAGGQALELGIGTGRIALPLQAKGIPVQGIDASEAMLTRLRAKPSGADIKVITTSFAGFQLPDRFQLIYVVFNTFFALLTQDEQVRCFQTVAQHLTSKGVFLLEVFIPNLSRFQDNQTVRAITLNENAVHLEVTQHDPLAQQSTSQHVVFSEQGTRLYPVKIRYAWPSELDLMARLAGLSLQHRWGSWVKDDLTPTSQRHISVYGLDS